MELHPEIENRSSSKPLEVHVVVTCLSPSIDEDAGKRLRLTART